MRQVIVLPHPPADSRAYIRLKLYWNWAISWLSPLKSPMPASLSPPKISIAWSFRKYFFVHGGFRIRDGNSANVLPLGLKIIVQVGAKSSHHHDVPILNSTLTSFLSCFSVPRSFPR